MSATTTPTATNPAALGSGVDNQKLALATPLIGRGLHFSLLSVIPPATDMWGNPITYPPTIGAHHKPAWVDA